MSPLAGAWRVGRGLAFTALLGGALAAVDRWVLGPAGAPEGSWVVLPVAPALESALRVPLPPYLPATLGWPPQRVFGRVGEAGAFYAGVTPAGGGNVVLWFGTSVDGDAPALGSAQPCALDAAQCADGWKRREATLRDGRTLRVVARLDDEELERFAEGLALARPRP